MLDATSRLPVIRVDEAQQIQAQRVYLAPPDVHLGHALSARTLLQSQSEEIEHPMWAAVRALTERAATLNKLADSAERRGSEAAAGFRERATEALTHSEQAGQFLLSLRMTRPDEEGS